MVFFYKDMVASATKWLCSKCGVINMIPIGEELKCKECVYGESKKS